MTVADVIEYAKYGELAQLSVVKQLSSNVSQEIIGAEKQIISYINLGMIELYKRFKLGVKAEVVDTYTGSNICTLHNKDVSNVIEVYNSSGKRLLFPTVHGDTTYDIKEISYNTFMLMKPIEEQLAFVYIASPEIAIVSTDELELPYIMLEPLLHYIGYRAHGSMDGNVDGENNTHYMRFEKSCNTLLAEGYYNATVDSLLTKDIAKDGWI